MTSKKILKEKMKFFEDTGKYPEFLIIDTYCLADLNNEISNDTGDDIEEEFQDMVVYEGMILAVVQKRDFEGFVLR